MIECKFGKDLSVSIATVSGFIVCLNDLNFRALIRKKTRKNVLVVVRVAWSGSRLMLNAET